MLVPPHLTAAPRIYSAASRRHTQIASIIGVGLAAACGLVATCVHTTEAVTISVFSREWLFRCCKRRFVLRHARLQGSGETNRQIRLTGLDGDVCGVRRLGAPAFTSSVELARELFTSGRCSYIDEGVRHGAKQASTRVIRSRANERSPSMDLNRPVLTARCPSLRLVACQRGHVGVPEPILESGRSDIQSWVVDCGGRQLVAPMFTMLDKTRVSVHCENDE